MPALQRSRVQIRYNGAAGNTAPTQATETRVILDRYITTETVRPLSIGVGLLIVVFAGYSSAVKLSQAAEGVIQASTVAELILLNTVIALEVLLPTALYLSVLAAVGRMHRDSEMVALNAAGISELRVMGAVLKLALVVAVLVGFLSLVGRPWAYRESYRIEAEAVAGFDIDKVEPGQFLELKDSHYVLFSRAVDRERGRLQDVFVQSDEGERPQVIYAREASLPRVEPGEPRTAEFHHGYAYRLDTHGQRDITLRFNTLVVQLGRDRVDNGYKRKAQPTLTLAQSERPKDVAEYQWRLSTPLATVLLALLAVPLARSSPRQSRFASTFVAILVYALLFNLISMARNWVEQGRVGTLPGLWWAYALPALLLVWLLVKPALARRR